MTKDMDGFDELDLMDSVDEENERHMCRCLPFEPSVEVRNQTSHGEPMEVDLPEIDDGVTNVVASYDGLPDDLEEFDL